MNLLLHRIHSHFKQSKEVKLDNDNFISDINDALINEDIVLTEEANVDDMDVVFVESGGSEEVFLKMFKKIKSPFIILSHGKYNSLAAAMEIKSYAGKYNKQGILTTGEIKEISELIKHFAQIYRSKEEINGARLGVIGKPSDWLIYSTVDYSEVYNKYGISLIDVEMEELKTEFDKKTYSRVKHLADFEKKWKNKAVLEDALCIYGALKRIINRYQLDGFTIRCFDLLKEYKNTACLALALLNEEGYVATCEGDVPSMLTMFFLNKLYGDSSFQANPSYIFFDKREILFAHCTVPFDMVRSFELDTHFESNQGIGIRGELSLVPCTIYKLAANLKDFIAIEGNIVRNEKLKEYCRTQIVVELPPRSLMEFISTDFGNHVCISYASDPNLFIAFVELFNQD